MSASAPITGADERLLTFEVSGGLYALPIDGVLEVAEICRVACIPTMPAHVGGVVNYHGDALPVLSWSSLCGIEATDQPGNFLVITDRGSDVARLGIAVDRVTGLVDGSAPAAAGNEIVAERRSINGRIASLLDPRQLVARAQSVIESSSDQRT